MEQEGDEVYGGMWYRGHRGARWGPGRPFFFMLVAGLVLLSVAGSAFHFFPLLLFLLVPFVLVPALRDVASGIGGIVAERAHRPAESGRREKELLEALARYGELSPARAAMETSLSVAEADRLLSALAKDGHIEVRAREGRLAYGLWERDLRELEERPQ